MDSIERFQNWAISVKDPFYTKHHLSHQEIAAFVDKRFFAGGEYFVDISEHPQPTATHAQTELPANGDNIVQLAQVNRLK